MAPPFFSSDYQVDAVALCGPGGVQLSYSDLEKQALNWAKRAAHSNKQLVFFYIPRRVEAVAYLLGLLESGHAVALLDPALKIDTRRSLEQLYKPWGIAADQEGNNSKLVLSLFPENERSAADAVHPDIFLLLSTSGSTGSPKFVKLSKAAVLQNAADILDVLGITSKDRALAHLDLHYSYGLSVLTSHLAAGASIAFPVGKFTERRFWDDLRALEATHLPGVPFHYEMMARLRFERLNIPSVRMMTQAGGRLAQQIQEKAFKFMSSVGGRFFVLYGQTEAAPRMSTLSHEMFNSKAGSVGLALKSGEFSILSQEGKNCGPGVIGEVSYKGRNVMMGYAKSGMDLSVGDENGGFLRTGDLGYLDKDAYLFITCRANRMGKVYGWRVNLDELENAVERFGSAAVIQKNEKIVIVTLENSEADQQDIRLFLSERFTLPQSVFSFSSVSGFPKTNRGKSDYAALEKLI
jgi:acyl-coenzyme A synthetase/AMP-(fatty) acid ligase